MNSIEKTVWKRFGIEIDSTASGWQTELPNRLSKDQLMDVVRTMSHMPELWRPALGRLLEHDLDESDLTSLLFPVGHENVAEVVRRLLDMSPTPDQLSDAILVSRDADAKRRAARRILEQDVSNSALQVLIVNVDDEALVWDAVRRWNPSDPHGDLAYVLRYSKNERVSEHFMDLLLGDGSCTTTNLAYVMSFSGLQSIKDRAAATLIRMDPNLDELSYIVNKCSIESIYVEACERILALKALDPFHLLGILEKHPSREVRNDIACRFLKYKPNSRRFKMLGADTAYSHILCHCDDASLCDAAWERLTGIERVGRWTFEFVAQKATFETYRREAQKRLDSAADDGVS
jgi:hypothetical protein